MYRGRTLIIKKLNGCVFSLRREVNWPVVQSHKSYCVVSVTATSGFLAGPNKTVSLYLSRPWIRHLPVCKQKNVLPREHLHLSSQCIYYIFGWTVRTSCKMFCFFVLPQKSLIESWNVHLHLCSTSLRTVRCLLGLDWISLEGAKFKPLVKFHILWLKKSTVWKPGWGT